MKLKIIEVKKSKTGFDVQFELDGKKHRLETARINTEENLLRALRRRITYHERLKAPVPNEIKQMEGKTYDLTEYLRLLET